MIPDKHGFGDEERRELEAYRKKEIEELRASVVALRAIVHEMEEVEKRSATTIKELRAEIDVLRTDLDNERRPVYDRT